MDNAKYHCVYEAHVPKVWKMNKAPLQEYLRSKRVHYDETDTVKTVQERAKQYKVENEMWVTELAVECRGHKALWTAPGYSHLQLIKLLWARIKGNVSRQYDAVTKLKDVHERLQREVA